MSDIINKANKLIEKRDSCLNIIGQLNSKGELRITTAANWSHCGTFNLEEYVSADCIKEVKNLLINDLGARVDFYSSRLTEIEASLTRLIGEQNEEL